MRFSLGLLVIAGYHAAHLRWGVDGPVNHAYEFEHPFSIHVVNRSDIPVFVDALDEDGDRWPALVHSRHSERIELSAPVGFLVPVTTRPLLADGPGTEQRQIEWLAESGKVLVVSVDVGAHEHRELQEVEISTGSGGEIDEHPMTLGPRMPEALGF